MIKYILMDVEGTTTSIEFVHQTLFPYSKMKLKSFLADNWENCLHERKLLKETLKKELSLESAVEVLEEFIKNDVKDSALKSLQGKIWKLGYESGEIKGHVYEDVEVAFKNWTKRGLTLGIYSSGSVLAQKLIFGYSSAGDLTKYLSHHFDTSIGHKREVHSYENIAKELNIIPESILFLSDMAPECEAAQNAGFQVAQLIRDDKTIKDDRFFGYKDFLEIKINAE